MESVQKQFITFFLRKSQSISNEFLSLQFSIPWKYKRIVKYILNIYNSFNQTYAVQNRSDHRRLKILRSRSSKKIT